MLFLIPLTALSYPVKVRVLSAKGLKPQTGIAVRITLSHNQQVPSPSSFLVYSEVAITDSQGVASFEVDKDEPTIFVTGVPDPCSSYLYNTDEVRKRGQMLPNCIKKYYQKAGIHPHPGEIIYFVSGLNWMERVLLRPWPS
ncbi:MAG: hypothetical protein M3Y24_01405 [Acidobacteriota bacterium]|nr:hypothetical protein [Acidobacteriota bacterium]